MPDTGDLQISAILEGIPHPAMILDAKCQICSMNRLIEAMTGYLKEEVTGLHGEFVLRSNVGNHRGQLFKKVAKSKESISVTGDILDANRQKVAVQYTVSPLFSNNNRFCGFLVVIEDISTHVTDSGVNIHHETTQEIIGYSPKMQAVLDLLPLLAQTDASVMITGETGTGKDKLAEVIHKNSSRSRYPFIKINCGALPPGLLESELFGHVKGAFTGATRDKPGMFKLAHRGTVFLTEIGDMPLPLQVKLLSFLDDREFVPVGGEQKISVDVRVIAATHKPLKKQIKKNEFREDLFYRLHVLHVHLPPLREREGDLQFLCDHFVQIFTTALGKNISGITPAAMKLLLNYKYPGNIRELKNIIEYAANVCRKKKIGQEHLPPYLTDVTEPEEKTEDTERQQPVAVIKTPASPIRNTHQTNGTWQDIEREMIVETLKKCAGNRTRTAEQLQWGRMKLWRKMKLYGLLD